MSPSDRRELISLGTKKWVRPGTVLLRAGDTGTTAILILRTFVKVSMPTANGHETLLSVRVPGDIVGEISVLNDQPRTATATTCGTGLVSVIPSPSLKEFMSERPAVGAELAGTAADRLRWTNEPRADVGSLPVVARLARLLSDLAIRHGVRTEQGIEISVMLTQSELASLIGVSVVTAQRAIKRLRDQGVIETGSQRFLVTDPHRLELEAAAPPR
ncbi:Crp/Fnr family transcriptional regulator [Stackebrandtia nassauensis]|uniref:Crp/Fnr family transcriptional regulator n=1 Tax=Stackebrandtia nassauensis TaxID=283811 RepID=UPI000316A9D4|nr:Crp/Fnr family transcriptional regulator [Stackebrandtia nassauensis]